MSHRHLRSLAFAATAVLMAGGFAGVTQAADPLPRIRDANPTQTRDLNGTASTERASGAIAVPASQEMKGVPAGSGAAPLVPPAEHDRKGGAASRTSGKEGGTLTPIGTLNIVRGEQPRQHITDSLAERPATEVDLGISGKR